MSRCQIPAMTWMVTMCHQPQSPQTVRKILRKIPLCKGSKTKVGQETLLCVLQKTTEQNGKTPSTETQQ